MPRVEDHAPIKTVQEQLLELLKANPHTGAAGDCLEDANLVTLSPSNRAGASLTLGAGVASLSRMLERHQSPEAICTHGLQVLKRAFEFQRVFLDLADAFLAGVGEAGVLLGVGGQHAGLVAPHMSGGEVAA